MQTMLWLFVENCMGGVLKVIYFLIMDQFCFGPLKWFTLMDKISHEQSLCLRIVHGVNCRCLYLKLWKEVDD